MARLALLHYLGYLIGGAPAGGRGMAGGTLKPGMRSTQVYLVADAAIAVKGRRWQSAQQTQGE
jgi:hypothetical protein